MSAFAMCGIYGFVDQASPPPDVEAFVDALAAFRRLSPDVTGGATELVDLCDRSIPLVHPEAFQLLTTTDGLLERFSTGVSGLETWIGDIEARLEGDRELTSAQIERLNESLTTGRDLAWRLRKDVIENVASVMELTGATPRDAGEGRSPAVTTGWQLNLAFNAIDRLEVRGRDSAGITVVLRFTDGHAVDEIVETGAEGLGDRLSTRMSHRAVIRSDDGVGASLVFVYKVADEVGKIGDNVQALRKAVRDDRLFWSLLAVDGVDSQLLAHTRWASNGVISVPNCHPVDGATELDGESRGHGRIIAVLNGDIDNYQELRARYVSTSINSEVTTDAKIIPILIEHHLAETDDLGIAFQRAFAEFEGSMAIAVIASDRPGELLIGRKGSGQGLFVGRAAAGVAVASELYGLVELTPTFLKLDVDGVDADGRSVGEVLRICSGPDGVTIQAVDDGALETVDDKRFAVAGITTRDIDRGDYPHFLLKEIRESVDTVRKTLRARFDIVDGKAEFRLGGDAVPREVIEALKSHAIRTVDVVGQGTAAVAALGIARLLDEAIGQADLTVRSMQATELSAHHLRPDMTDTLVIAVSQSGTTTDTNRTVAMMRERGARVLVIVNRRNSDLVFRADGVIYTSDGRDVEMSVASTKAFYAQNVAGRLLALYLASELGTMSPEQIVDGLHKLRTLPDLLQRTLQQGDAIARVARRYASRHKHWAVVGSGFGKVVADEIRIKLSELCYKSIAVDSIEDKKHIDLSSEPLVLVCANGLPAANVSDVVKEIAIFKAHRSVPIVITEEGEDRFDAHASAVLRVPACRDAMSYLLAAMVGHLFGYYAALSFDALADDLRRQRTHLVSEAAKVESGSTDTSELDGLVSSAGKELVDFSTRLADGEFDGCLDASMAVRLYGLIDLLLARRPLGDLRRVSHRQGTVGQLFELAIETWSEAIAELSRPIDAIKHQAKTVTVGTSRSALTPIPGALWDPLRNSNRELAAVDDDVMAFLNAFQPLVSEVLGVTRYVVEGLDALGRPTETSVIRTLEKRGIAESLSSRADAGVTLSGTKWAVLRERSIYLGTGQVDGRRILIFSAASGANVELYLYHIDLIAQGERRRRMAALRALHARHDSLIASVTEVNVSWEPTLIDAVDNEVLFFASIDDASKAIVKGASG